MKSESALQRLRRFERKLKRIERIQTIPLVRLRDRQNPFEMYSASEFKKKYHMYKETAFFILKEIVNELKLSELKRGCQLPTALQLTTVLRFYCTGSFQNLIADNTDMNQSTVSRLIKRVSFAIAKLCPKYVKFPTEAEANEVREMFYKTANFPGVTGAIDCCHIRINSPGKRYPELFRNRKGYFSINVQAICDPELNFTNVIAKWYGSAHDQRIFENSQIAVNLETGASPGILVGDSGYTLTRYVMTPLRHPATRAQLKYNKSQIKTRNSIERCFGIWKRRFPCLNHLRTKLSPTLIIIVATSVLHNISRRRSDIFEMDKFSPDQQDQIVSPNCSTESGNNYQKSLIENYFNC